MTNNRRAFAPMLAIVVGGMVSLALGWRIVAGTLGIGVQVPALVSGTFAGLVLLLAGAILVDIQIDRWMNARRSAAFNALLDEAATLVAVAPKFAQRLAERRKRR